MPCAGLSELSLNTLICANYWTPPCLLHPPTMLKSAASAQRSLTAEGIWPHHGQNIKAQLLPELADSISDLVYIGLPL